MQSIVQGRQHIVRCCRINHCSLSKPTRKPRFLKSLAKKKTTLSNRMIFNLSEYLKSQLLVKTAGLKLERIEPNPNAIVRSS